MDDQVAVGRTCKTVQDANEKFKEWKGWFETRNSYDTSIDHILANYFLKEDN